MKRLVMLAILVSFLDVVGAYAFELPMEAEDFTLGKGWKVTDYGYFPSQPNYWSVKKIAADESDTPAVAFRVIDVPETREYRLWVRYESCYGFGSVFTVKIKQNGKVKAEGVFGRKEDKKYFPFGKGYTVQGAWNWHNTDYVYQGMSAELEKGKAEILIEKGVNERPAARRIIDLLYLTDDLSLIPGDDWDWRGNRRPPILSRFKVPVYLKVKADSGEGFLKVVTVFALFGNHPYVFHETFYIGSNGIAATPPGQTALLKKNSVVPWQKVEVYSVMTPGIVLSQKGTARVTVDIAVRSPSNVVKTLTLGPDEKECTVIVGIGLGKYEKGLLGSHKALTTEEMLNKQISILEKYQPPGKPAWHHLFTGGVGDELTELQLKLGVACGLNGEAYRVHPQMYGIHPTLTGYNTTVGQGVVANQHLTKECYEGDFTRIEAQWRSYAASIEKTLGRKLPLHIKLLEETGPPDMNTLLSWPKVKEQFIRYLSDQGLSLESVQQDTDVYFYHSHRFRAFIFARVCADATRLLERIFPPGTYVHSGSIHPSSGGFPTLARGDDVFLLFRNRGVTEFSSEMSWSLGGTPNYIGPQTQSYEAALGRALAKYYHCPMGSYLIADGNRGYTGDYVEMASYPMFCQGFSWLHYYYFGWPEGNSFIGYPDVLKGIKRANRTIGAIEDELVGAKVVQGKVAVGWSSTTDVWDLARPPSYEHSPGNCVYPQERQNLYLMLRHLQYPVDILSEEDLAEGYLKGYQAYVLVGDHLRPEAAEALKKWVAEGGTLVAVAGGGLYDQYNRPLDTLKEVFGITDAKIKKETDALRPKLELVHMKPLDTITFTNGKKMEVYGYRQNFTVGEGKIVGKYENGDIAAVTHQYGKGKAVIVGALPGPAYFKPGIPEWPYGRGGEKELSQFFPVKFSKEIAEIVDSWFEGIEKPVVCAEPLVEAVVLEKEKGGGYVIPLINFTQKNITRLQVRIAKSVVEDRSVKVVFGKARVKKDKNGDTVVTLLCMKKFECLILK